MRRAAHLCLWGHISLHSHADREGPGESTTEVLTGLCEGVTGPRSVFLRIRDRVSACSHAPRQKKILHNDRISGAANEGLLATLRKRVPRRLQRCSGPRPIFRMLETTLIRVRQALRRSMARPAGEGFTVVLCRLPPTIRLTPPKIAGIPRMIIRIRKASWPPLEPRFDKQPRTIAGITTMRIAAGPTRQELGSAGTLGQE